jgi:hypothetical protein
MKGITSDNPASCICLCGLFIEVVGIDAGVGCLISERLLFSCQSSGDRAGVHDNAYHISWLNHGLAIISASSIKSRYLGDVLVFRCKVFRRSILEMV